MSYVAFSPDGTMVASDGPAPDGENHGITIWNFSDGAFVRAIKARYLSDDWSIAVADGALLDARSGKTLLKDAALTDSIVAFSPDHSFAVAASLERVPRVTMIRVSDGTILRSFGTRYVSAIAVSPDGNIIATGHWDNVTLWDARSGKRLALLRGFGRYIESISFSADGRLLTAGTDYGELQVWDFAGRKLLHKIDVGGADVSAPAYSPDGKYVAVGTYANGTLTLVDIVRGRVVQQIKVSDLGCGSAAFTPDGRYVIVPSTGGIPGLRRYEVGGTIRVYELMRDATAE